MGGGGKGGEQAGREAQDPSKLLQMELRDLEKWERNLRVFVVFVQAAHVKIVAIGISQQVALDELVIMAGDNHYVLVKTFDDLSDAMQEVLDKVCT